jgi:TetR/AcrR family transcriptional regulator, transcriptional repressor for nem operon
MGHGLLPKLRAGNPAAALDAYLDRDDLAANALACTLASLAGDIARAPLPARLAYANVLHGVIAELAKGRQRRGLDADATVAAILAVGAVVMARASGDPRLRTVKPLMKKPAKKRPKPKRRVSRVKKRSPSHRKAAAARPSRRAARSRGGRA